MTTVKTQKAGEKYVAKIDGTNVTFQAVEREGSPMVWAYTAKSSLGLYRLERFGGELTLNSVRAFLGS